MANTKISQLTENTNPTGNEELVYAYNNANGKMTLDTMKTYATTGTQAELVSGTNIKTINSQSLLGSGNLDISGGIAYTAGTGISVTSGVISNTGVTSVNGQTGAVTVSGGGSGGYDCVVAADGTGDYTTIAAAVNAGKQNIFVRNGNYTENVQRDVYTAGKNMLHITGESYLGVNITVDKDTPTLNSNGRFINMQVPTGFTEFDFYMKNLNFVLDFSGGISYFFRTGGSSKGKFLVEDCGFTYSGGTGNNYLFFGSNIFEMTSDGNSYGGTKCNMFNRCVFECSTDATTGFVYIMSSGSIAAENCVFLTSGTGVMSIVGSGSGGGYIKHCRLEVYGLYFNEGISIINCRIKIASGGTFYQHSSSLPNDFGCEFIENSEFSINGDLGTAGTVALGGVCKNCTISISATNLTGFELGRGLYLNKRNCFGTRVSYSGTVTLNANTYGLDLTTTSLVIAGDGLHYSGINAYGGTVSITADNAVVIGNNWNGATVTDTGTGNVVANNVA